MDYISTVIVGTPTICRAGLRDVLLDSRFRVIAEATTPRDAAIESLRAPPDLCILTPGDHSEVLIRTLHEMRDRFPSSRLVVLYEAQGLHAPSKFFEAGVHGCLPATMHVSRLLNALDLLLVEQLSIKIVDRDVTAGVSGSAAHRDLAKPAMTRRFSNREAEILAGIRNGESNKHIARRLVIAEATVKVHVRSLLRKIGVQNRTSAAIWAMSSLPMESREATIQVPALG